MPRNIEIKAKISSLEQIRQKVEPLATSPVEILEQQDIFFQIPKGRLKLRIFSEKAGELIYYERLDQEGPKLSSYSISPTQEPESLKIVLSQALGICGEVCKTRWVYLVHQTRVHLDRVKNLGEFLELEVVLTPEDSFQTGETIAKDLLQKLDIKQTDLLAGAYLDLLEKQNVGD